jgi:hypothetical protein
MVPKQKVAGGLAKGTRGALRGKNASGDTVLVLPETTVPTLASAGISLKLFLVRTEARQALACRVFEESYRASGDKAVAQDEKRRRYNGWTAVEAREDSEG